MTDVEPKSAKITRQTMKFCPLCFNMLMIQQSISAVRLMCNGCKYYYPLDKPIRSKVVMAKRKALEIVEQHQATKQLPIAQETCPKCGHGKAYLQQRQTRSADQAETLFFTCVSCSHKWTQ